MFFFYYFNECLNCECIHLHYIPTGGVVIETVTGEKKIQYIEPPRQEYQDSYSGILLFMISLKMEKLIKHNKKQKKTNKTVKQRNKQSKTKYKKYK